jgi:ankyrin repeat protein
MSPPGGCGFITLAGKISPVRLSGALKRCIDEGLSVADFGDLFQRKTLNELIMLIGRVEQHQRNGLIDVFQTIFGFTVRTNPPDSLASELAPLAASTLNSRLVKFHLDHDVSVNVKGEHGKKLLHLSQKPKGGLKLAKILLEYDAWLIGCQDDFGRTPLYLAVEEGNISMAALLLKRGDQWRVANKHGIHPLFLACKKGDLDMVLVLLNSGASPHTRGPGGETPLFPATIEASNNYSEENRFSIMKALVQKGGDVDAKDDSGRSVQDCVSGPMAYKLKGVLKANQCLEQLDDYDTWS